MQTKAYNKSTGSLLSKTLAVTFLILLSASAMAQEQCKSVFSSGRAAGMPTPESVQQASRKLPAYGALKASFKWNPDYKVLVPEQSQVRNQCSLGTCHLYSWVSLLEQEFKAASAKEIKISADYLSARHWIQKSLENLSQAGGPIKIQLGANVIHSRSLIEQYGIIPDQVWAGHAQFNQAPLSDRMTEYVQNIIARAHSKISKSVNQEVHAAILSQAKEQILTAFEKQIGAFPETFEYEGQIYTPQSFQKQFFPELAKPVWLMSATPSQKSPTTLNQVTKTFGVISTNIDQLEATARQLIDQGLNVYLTYDHNSNYVDNRTGIMSIAAFEMPPGGGPLSRSDRQEFGFGPSGHAVQIVGYDFDPKTNKVLKWKIKNSWGKQPGDDGYYHMFADYFRTFAVNISFFETSAIQLPKIEKTVPMQGNLFF